MHEMNNKSDFKNTGRLYQSVLCLFIAFVFLLSCQMIKTIESFVFGPDHVASSQTAAVKKIKTTSEHIIAYACSTTQQLASTKIDGTFNANVSVLSVALVLISVFAVVSLALQAAHQRHALACIATSAFPISVTPIYIRHRLLLI